MKLKRLLIITFALIAIGLFVVNTPQSAAANGESIHHSYVNRVQGKVDHLNTFLEENGYSHSEYLVRANFKSKNPNDWHGEIVRIVQVNEFTWKDTYKWQDAAGRQFSESTGNQIPKNQTYELGVISNNGYQITWRSPFYGDGAIREPVAMWTNRLRRQAESRPTISQEEPTSRLDGQAEHVLGYLDAYREAQTSNQKVCTRKNFLDALRRFLGRHPTCLNWKAYERGYTNLDIIGRYERGWCYGRASSEEVLIGERLPWEEFLERICEESGVTVSNPDLSVAVITSTDSDMAKVSEMIQEAADHGLIYADITRYNITSGDYKLLFGTHETQTGVIHLYDHHLLWVGTTNSRGSSGDNVTLTRFERDVLAAWLRDAQGTLVLGGQDDGGKEPFIPNEAYTGLHPVDWFEKGVGTAWTMDPTVIFDFEQGFGGWNQTTGEAFRYRKSQSYAYRTWGVDGETFVLPGNETYLYRTLTKDELPDTVKFHLEVAASDPQHDDYSQNIQCGLWWNGQFQPVRSGGTYYSYKTIIPGDTGWHNMNYVSTSNWKQSAPSTIQFRIRCRNFNGSDVYLDFDNILMRALPNDEIINASASTKSYVGQGLEVCTNSTNGPAQGEAWTYQFEIADTVDQDIYVRFYENIEFWYRSTRDFKLYVAVDWLADPNQRTIEFYVNATGGVWQQYCVNIWNESFDGRAYPDLIKKLRFAVPIGQSGNGFNWGFTNDDVFEVDEINMVGRGGASMTPFLDKHLRNMEGDNLGFGEDFEVYTWDPATQSGNQSYTYWDVDFYNGTGQFHIWAGVPTPGAPPGPYTTESYTSLPNTIWWEESRGPSWIEYLNVAQPQQKLWTTGLDLTNLGTIQNPIWVQDGEQAPLLVIETTNHSQWYYTDPIEFMNIIKTYPDVVWGVGIQSTRATTGFALNPEGTYTLGQMVYGPRLNDRTLPTLATSQYHVMPRLLAKIGSNWYSRSLARINKDHWAETGTDPRLTMTARVNAKEGWTEISYTTGYASVLTSTWSYTLRIRVHHDDPNPKLKIDLTCHSHTLQDLGVAYDLLSTGWRTNYDLTQVSSTVEDTEHIHSVDVVKDISDPALLLRFMSQNERGFFFDYKDMVTSGFSNPRLRVLDVQVPWGGTQRVIQVGMTSYGTVPANSTVNIDPQLTEYGVCDADDLYAWQDEESSYGGSTSGNLTLGIDGYTAYEEQQVTLYPVADAYTTSAIPSYNCGTKTWIMVDNGVSNGKRGYLKFDLSNLPGDIISATLKLKITTILDVHGTITCYNVSDTSWTETGINWNNQPSLGASLDTDSSGSVGDWDTFTVTDWVLEEEGDYMSLGLTKSGLGGLKYASREYSGTSSDPKLVVVCNVSSQAYKSCRVLTRFNITDVPLDPLQQIDSAFLYYPVLDMGGTNNHTVYAYPVTNTSWDSASYEARWNWTTAGSALTATANSSLLVVNVTDSVQDAYDAEATYAAWRLNLLDDTSSVWLDWFALNSSYPGGASSARLEIIYTEVLYAPEVSGTRILGMHDDSGAPYGVGWLDGWQFRRNHTLSGTGTALTNYSVAINVHYGSGTDSGNIVFLDEHCQPDFDDIRFTADDGQTLLSYWRENYTIGVSATFWVKVLSIPAAGNTTFCLYHSEGAVTTTSSLVDTFFFGDSFDGAVFDTGKWGVSEFVNGTHSYNQTGGELHIHTESNDDPSGYRFTTLQNFSLSNFTLYVRTRWDNRDGFRGELGDGFLEVLLWDADGNRTGELVTLNGSAMDYFRRWRDGAGPDGMNPSGGTSGDAIFVYTLVDGNWSLSLEYDSQDYSWSGPLTNFSFPFTISLATVMDYLTSQVSVDVYYDYVYLRERAVNEPSHSSWTEEETLGEGDPSTWDNCYTGNTYTIEVTIGDLNGWDDIEYVNVSMAGEATLYYHYYYHEGEGECLCTPPTHHDSPDGCPNWYWYIEPGWYYSGTFGAHTTRTVLNDTHIVVQWDYNPGWSSSVDGANITSVTRDYAEKEDTECIPDYVDLFRGLGVFDYAVSDIHVNPLEVVGFSGRVHFVNGTGGANRAYYGTVLVGYDTGGMGGWKTLATTTSNLTGYYNLGVEMEEDMDYYYMASKAVDCSTPFVGTNISVDGLVLEQALVTDTDWWVNSNTTFSWVFQCHYYNNATHYLANWTLEWNGALYNDTDCDGNITISYQGYDLAVDFLGKAVDDGPSDNINATANSLDYEIVYTRAVFSLTLDAQYLPMGVGVGVQIFEAFWAHEPSLAYRGNVTILANGTLLVPKNATALLAVWEYSSVVSPLWWNYTVSATSRTNVSFSVSMPNASWNPYGITLCTILNNHSWCVWDIDTDYDGLIDIVETEIYNTSATSFDTDGDMMPDLWEIQYELDPLVDDASADLDNDTLTNLNEYLWGLDPSHSDTDCDGLPDDWELLYDYLVLYDSFEDGGNNWLYNTSITLRTDVVHNGTYSAQFNNITRTWVHANLSLIEDSSMFGVWLYANTSGDYVIQIQLNNSLWFNSTTIWVPAQQWTLIEVRPLNYVNTTGIVTAIAVVGGTLADILDDAYVALHADESHLDSDYDGRANVIEFGLGTSPVNASEPGLFQITVYSDTFEVFNTSSGDWYIRFDAWASDNLRFRIHLYNNMTVIWSTEWTYGEGALYVIRDRYGTLPTNLSVTRIGIEYESLDGFPAELRVELLQVYALSDMPRTLRWHDMSDHSSEYRDNAELLFNNFGGGRLFDMPKGVPTTLDVAAGIPDWWIDQFPTNPLVTFMEYETDSGNQYSLGMQQARVTGSEWMLYVDPLDTYPILDTMFENLDKASVLSEGFEGIALGSYAYTKDVLEHEWDSGFWNDWKVVPEGGNRVLAQDAGEEISIWSHVGDERVRDCEFEIDVTSDEAEVYLYFRTRWSSPTTNSDVDGYCVLLEQDKSLLNSSLTNVRMKLYRSDEDDLELLKEIEWEYVDPQDQAIPTHHVSIKCRGGTILVTSSYQVRGKFSNYVSRHTLEVIDSTYEYGGIGIRTKCTFTSSVSQHFDNIRLAILAPPSADDFTERDISRPRLNESLSEYVEGRLIVDLQVNDNSTSFILGANDDETEVWPLGAPTIIESQMGQFDWGVPIINTSIDEGYFVWFDENATHVFCFVYWYNSSNTDFDGKLVFNQYLTVESVEAVGFNISEVVYYTGGHGVCFDPTWTNALCGINITLSFTGGYIEHPWMKKQTLYGDAQYNSSYYLKFDDAYGVAYLVSQIYVPTAIEYGSVQIRKQYLSNPEYSTLFVDVYLNGEQLYNNGTGYYRAPYGEERYLHAGFNELKFRIEVQTNVSAILQGSGASTLYQKAYLLDICFREPDDTKIATRYAVSYCDAEYHTMASLGLGEGVIMLYGFLDSEDTSSREGLYRLQTDGSGIRNLGDVGAGHLFTENVIEHANILFDAAFISTRALVSSLNNTAKYWPIKRGQMYGYQANQTPGDIAYYFTRAFQTACEGNLSATADYLSSIINSWAAPGTVPLHSRVHNGFFAWDETYGERCTYAPWVEYDAGEDCVYLGMSYGQYDVNTPPIPSDELYFYKSKWYKITSDQTVIRLDDPHPWGASVSDIFFENGIIENPPRGWYGLNETDGANPYYSKGTSCNLVDALNETARMWEMWTRDCQFPGFQSYGNLITKAVELIADITIKPQIDAVFEQAWLTDLYMIALRAAQGLTILPPALLSVIYGRQYIDSSESLITVDGTGIIYNWGMMRLDMAMWEAAITRLYDVNVKDAQSLSDVSQSNLQYETIFKSMQRVQKAAELGIDQTHVIHYGSRVLVWDPITGPTILPGETLGQHQSRRGSAHADSFLANLGLEFHLYGITSPAELGQGARGKTPELTPITMVRVVNPPEPVVEQATGSCFPDSPINQDRIHAVLEQEALLATSNYGIVQIKYQQRNREAWAAVVAAAVGLEGETMPDGTPRLRVFTNRIDGSGGPIAFVDMKTGHILAICRYPNGLSHSRIVAITSEGKISCHLKGGSEGGAVDTSGYWTTLPYIPADREGKGPMAILEDSGIILLEKIDSQTGEMRSVKSGSADDQALPEVEVLVERPTAPGSELFTFSARSASQSGVTELQTRMVVNTRAHTDLENVDGQSSFGATDPMMRSIGYVELWPVATTLKGRSQRERNMRTILTRAVQKAGRPGGLKTGINSLEARYSNVFMVFRACSAWSLFDGRFGPSVAFQDDAGQSLWPATIAGHNPSTDEGKAINAQLKQLILSADPASLTLYDLSMIASRWEYVTKIPDGGGKTDGTLLPHGVENRMTAELSSMLAEMRPMLRGGHENTNMKYGVVSVDTKLEAEVKRRQKTIDENNLFDHTENTELQMPSGMTAEEKAQRNARKGLGWMDLTLMGRYTFSSGYTFHNFELVVGHDLYPDTSYNPHVLMPAMMVGRGVWLYKDPSGVERPLGHVYSSMQVVMTAYVARRDYAYQHESLAARVAYFAWLQRTLPYNYRVKETLDALFAPAAQGGLEWGSFIDHLSTTLQIIRSIYASAVPSVDINDYIAQLVSLEVNEPYPEIGAPVTSQTFMGPSVTALQSWFQHVYRPALGADNPLNGQNKLMRGLKGHSSVIRTIVGTNTPSDSRLQVLTWKDSTGASMEDIMNPTTEGGKNRLKLPIIEMNEETGMLVVKDDDNAETVQGPVFDHLRVRINAHEVSSWNIDRRKASTLLSFSKFLGVITANAEDLKGARMASQTAFDGSLAKKMGYEIHAGGCWQRLSSNVIAFGNGITGAFAGDSWSPTDLVSVLSTRPPTTMTCGDMWAGNVHAVLDKMWVAQHGGDNYAAAQAYVEMMKGYDSSDLTTRLYADFARHTGSILNGEVNRFTPTSRTSTARDAMSVNAPNVVDGSPSTIYDSASGGILGNLKREGWNTIKHIYNVADKNSLIAFLLFWSAIGVAAGIHAFRWYGMHGGAGDGSVARWYGTELGPSNKWQHAFTLATVVYVTDYLDCFRHKFIQVNPDFTTTTGWASYDFTSEFANCIFSGLAIGLAGWLGYPSRDAEEGAPGTASTSWIGWQDAYMVDWDNAPRQCLEWMTAHEDVGGCGNEFWGSVPAQWFWVIFWQFIQFNIGAALFYVDFKFNGGTKTTYTAMLKAAIMSWLMNQIASLSITLVISCLAAAMAAETLPVYSLEDLGLVDEEEARGVTLIYMGGGNAYAGNFWYRTT